MASIAKDPGGRKRILFVGPDKRRKAIRLGKVPQRAAEAVKVKVEHLAGAAVSGCGWDNETARWVAEIPDELADKLAAVGLIPKRQVVALGTFLDDYIKSRTDVKRRSKQNYGMARQSLLTHFGRDKLLRDVTEGDAEGFHLWLKEQYAEATASRRIKYAWQDSNLRPPV